MSYFVTACTKDRNPVLCEIGPNVLSAFETLKGDVSIHAATVMPDHLHVLFTLGTRLRLGQVVGKLKAASRGENLSCRWQDDFFDRRVRENEGLEEYGFYIFMNPYRAGLVGLDERWPWWFCPDSSRFGFLGHLCGEHRLPSEWIEESRRFRSRLMNDQS